MTETSVAALMAREPKETATPPENLIRAKAVMDRLAAFPARRCGAMAGTQSLIFPNLFTFAVSAIGWPVK